MSERTLSEGLEFIDNRFHVEGNYKYTYNKCHLAMADIHATAVNFLNAWNASRRLSRSTRKRTGYWSVRYRGCERGGQDVEEGGRVEVVEVRTCHPRSQDTAGTGSRHGETMDKGRNREAVRRWQKRRTYRNRMLPLISSSVTIIIGNPGIPESKEARGMKI